MQFPEPIQRIMLEMQVAQLERTRSAVVADPVKHKLTTHFPENARMRWLYFEVKGKRGPRVRYCYSTERNLAGYFIAWRETWSEKKGRGKRDMWIASKRRKTVADKSRARWQSHDARLKKEEA
jgi:hypothetical protein